MPGISLAVFVRCRLKTVPQKNGKRFCRNRSAEKTEVVDPMDFREDSFMLALGAAVVLFILAQSTAFLVRAFKRGKQIGLSNQILKNTVIQSVLFTVTPALAIVATIIALTPALGIILPWIRLSVIGNITQETAAASAAVEAASGGAAGLATPITDQTTFATVMWVMTLASSLPLVVLPLCLKRIQRGVNRAMGKSGDAKLTDSFAAAAFIGLIAAFIARALAGRGTAVRAADGLIQYNYDGAGLLSVSTLLVAVGLMLVLSRLAEKKEIGWLQNFAMPISMFAAMGFAVFLSQILPETIAHFEFRPPIVG